MEKIRTKNHPTPVGNLLVAVDENDAVCVVTFAGETRFDEWRERHAPGVERCDAPFEHPIFAQLDAYFAGGRADFDVTLNAHGTEFQTQVWDALRDIPHGETWSYQQLANYLGNPGAVRAVGAANGQNPIAILNPCHRVIGNGGELRGFAGGVHIKRALLELEHAQCVAQTSLF